MHTVSLRTNILRLDIFSLNQHDRGCANSRKPWGSCSCGSARDPPEPGWISGAFRETLKGVGRVAVVLDPWQKPAALSRAWCLWRVKPARSQSQLHPLVPKPQLTARIRIRHPPPVYPSVSVSVSVAGR